MFSRPFIWTTIKSIQVRLNKNSINFFITFSLSYENYTLESVKVNSSNTKIYILVKSAINNYKWIELKDMV